MMVHPCRSITPKELSPLPCTNCPYHVVPDSPLMYVTQSRRFNFLSPMRLPYSPVIDFSPPPVVMIATTGTCRTEKDGTFTLMDCHGVRPLYPAWVLISRCRFLSGRKGSKMATTTTAASLWINKGLEIDPNLCFWSSLV